MDELIANFVVQPLLLVKNLKGNTRILKRKLNSLQSGIADVSAELKCAEGHSGKKRKKRVENWLSNVAKNIREFESLEQQVQRIRFYQFYSRLNLAERVATMTEEVTELVNQGQKIEIADMDRDFNMDMDMDTDGEFQSTGAILSTTNTCTSLTNIPPLPPMTLGKKKSSRKTSEVWDHFTIIGDPNAEDVRCECKYCEQSYACGTKKCGTSTLRADLTSHCKRYPGRVEDKRQKILSFDKREEGGESNFMAIGFSKEACRLACAKMVIIDELPFSFVERSGFRHFCSVACPRFEPPSRRTVIRDIYQLFFDERLKLRNIFTTQRQRVSLTTHTWTSIQNVNYMSLTAHFVDSDWMIQKRILNFCVISNHKGETIGKLIENCLQEWGIDRVFTITVDNASANETAISYLRRKMLGWGIDSCVLDGKYLHMRCCAHIANLIVCEGLKEAHDSIISIRNAVKYVKSSPARYEKLKECATKEKIESKSIVFLDMPTRWNSTYLMLEAALKYQKAFERLEKDDGHFLAYFREDDGGRRRGGPPSIRDWENASIFVKFLKSFYDVTLKFSTSLNVSSNVYLHEVCSLVADLEDWRSSGDSFLSEMANNMKHKFDKYWGKMDNVNQMLLIATVLDPRYKLDYIEYNFCDIYNDDVVGRAMTEGVKNNLIAIYDWYVQFEGNTQSSEDTRDVDSTSGFSSASHVSTISSGSTVRMSKFKEKFASKDSVELKNDMERYLSEAREDVDIKDFDVLNWWRVHGNKYTTLSKLAKDVLAIQVSTVASESAFSTGGRILDPFRSSLTPKMVEVLVSTQNWFKSTPSEERFYVEDVEYYNKLELSESITKNKESSNEK